LANIDVIIMNKQNKRYW